MPIKRNLIQEIVEGKCSLTWEKIPTMFISSIKSKVYNYEKKTGKNSAIKRSKKDAINLVKDE